MLSTDCCQKLQDELCGFRLSCPTLSTDDHTLIPLPSLHEVVGIVGCGKDVRGLLPYLLVFVAIDVSLIVDGKKLVGVDCDEDGACQGLQNVYREGV